MVKNLINSTIPNGKVPAERQPVPAPVDMICLNDVVQLMVNWLWYPYLPLGKLTAILGNPGEGKTYTVMSIIAACTNGRLLPGMKEPMQPFNVIYQTAEDGLGDTVKPRLIEAGADLTRVFSIDDTASLLTLSDERVETVRPSPSSWTRKMASSGLAITRSQRTICSPAQRQSARTKPTRPRRSSASC